MALFCPKKREVLCTAISDPKFAEKRHRWIFSCHRADDGLHELRRNEVRNKSCNGCKFAGLFAVRVRADA